MKRLIATVGAAAALAGCASETALPPPPPPPPPIRRPMPPPPPPPPTFHAEDFAWSAVAGPNAIVGTVVYRGEGGERWTCAGGSVALTPETPYSRRRIEALYGSTEVAVEPISALRRRSIGTASPEYGRFVRSTRCSARNTFAFSRLPDGDYFLVTALRPRAGAPESVAVMRRVEMRGGGVHRVTLPGPPR